MLLIAATAAAPLWFVRFDEPTLPLRVCKGLAKAGSLCGTVLIVWQFLLGIRSLAGRALVDLIWVLKLHKTIGKYALFLIALHPLFITVYYLDVKGINPLLLQGGRPFGGYVALGQLAFLLLVLIVVTSVFLRERLSARAWYGFHLTGYLALPLALVHGYPIGMTIGRTGLRAPWEGMAAGVAVLYLFRILCRFGLLSGRHTISEVERVGPGTVKITARPEGRRIEPRLGQFVYLRWGRSGLARPFTVSHYDPGSGNLSVTVKAMGGVSTRLQSIAPGQTVYVEGPYGVFSQAARESDRPMVMIAGGIGITPFMRLFEELACDPSRELHLFYGNRRTHEIIYRKELESVRADTVIHVLSDDPNYPGETGFITTGLLRKYLPRELAAYEFLICGPPAMTRKLEDALAAESVPPRQIHHELFSY